MWIFTATGFVSAVYKDGALQVRARDCESLQTLVDETSAIVVATPLADYPYRISITKEKFVAWLSNQAMSINYKNFKTEVADVRGYSFANSLSQVWSVMHDVEDEKARIQ